MANHDDPQYKNKLGSGCADRNSCGCSNMLLFSIHHCVIPGRFPQPNRNGYSHVDTHSDRNVHAYIYAHIHPDTNVHPHSNSKPDKYVNPQRDPNSLRSLRFWQCVDTTTSRYY